MTQRIALHHRTTYKYDRLVQLGPQSIRLRPAPHCRTPIESYSLRIGPDEHFLNWQQDPQGNFLGRVVLPEKTDRFEVVVDLVAEMAIINPFDFFVEKSAETWPFEYDPRQREELEPYLEAEKPGPHLAAWLETVPQMAAELGEKAVTIDLLVALNARIERDTEYLIRMEPGVQTPEETLELGRGSCRDSAWLQVQILRNLGIAARFASGYLIQLVADQKALDGPSGTTEDFTDLHAWAEAYVPGAGWIGLDATSGLLAGEGHIPLACTSKPQTAAPIDGDVEACGVDFSHEMGVERIFESPRVTKPYTEEAWAEIDALAERVDASLEKGDVRLTMGGEPTFVSLDDRDGAEWSTDADGPTKRKLSSDLIRRLKHHYAPGGLLHYGQGKWYPGEPLPRWALSLYWRDDGVPLLGDQSDFSEVSAPEDRGAETGEDEKSIPVNRPADVKLARELTSEIALRLEVDPAAITSAYEDPLEKMRAAARGEEDAAADAAQADDPVAFVLPVRARNDGEGGRCWQTEKWTFRREPCTLAPGDSPAGYRLPMNDLPILDPGEYPYIVAADPTVAKKPLAPPLARRQPFLTALRAKAAGKKATPVAGSKAPSPKAPKPGPVRSALVIEPRGGHICVFLPPLETADDFIDLIAAIEDAAAALSTKVVIDGYMPPRDSRLKHMSVTPDPGVIEVNIQPAHDWPTLRKNAEILYEEARLARLATEKFLVDGRHTGTGGGNHIVLGGPTPNDSPFLRRPHLLRSVVGYWLNHPSLSYLFSGLFIGPTSQAPRIDEARQDVLYELEIAFAQISSDDSEVRPPWLVDRIFRDMLVDVTGNTHRAEICIDKLYSPDSSTGRLGLVEFRAFEMPPHARMSLVQQLLLRAMIARFWDAPYVAPVARWGTALHDRFMLPHFVWSDFKDVLADLKQSGFDFDPEWFGPHFEFRFPRYGSFRYGDVEVEVRHALEPWNVLGEEGGAGATARYVDSSVERLQLHATGLTPDRFSQACNGVEIPLHATGRTDEAVAGVRYRAWQPARCLHPTIPVQAPLSFDLYDRWNGRVVAGCRYHVSHPGGRSFETFPINANEAEGRRLARFTSFGHTPAQRDILSAEPSREFPITLDLRRFPMHSSEAAD